MFVASKSHTHYYYCCIGGSLWREGSYRETCLRDHSDMLLVARFAELAVIRICGLDQNHSLVVTCLVRMQLSGDRRSCCTCKHKSKRHTQEDSVCYVCQIAAVENTFVINKSACTTERIARTERHLLHIYFLIYIAYWGDDDTPVCQIGKPLDQTVSRSNY